MHTQIPGGLQGLLTGGPLLLWANPESPYWLLNLLSFAVLVLLAWYLHKRVTAFPLWWLLLWVLLSPWTLHFSTRIENPSYVLFGSVLFFIALAELTMFYAARTFPAPLAFLALGAGIGWIMQLHLSWVLLPPFVLWALWKGRLKGQLLWRGIIFFTTGLVLMCGTLFPVWMRFG